MMYGSKRVAVRDLNPHILCALCGGYLIQATTVIECLHSFCRSCIVNFLETSKVCPICDAQIHKTRPLLNIRPDQTLQSLVYKLVPGLFQDEMRRRREFHATLSESDVEDLSLEERGEASLEKEFKPGDDHVSLVLQLASRDSKAKPFEIRDRRYLLCPSEVTVQHLKKFIRMKFQLTDSHKIDMYRAREELSDDLMLQDIALIYSWRGERPMILCYTITESPRAKFHDWLKQQASDSKQSDHTIPESSSVKLTNAESKPKHSTTFHEESASLFTKSAPSVTITPVSKSHVPVSTSPSVSMTPSSTMGSIYSSPNISTTSNSVVVACLPLPSVCNNVEKKSVFAGTLSTISNVKEFKPPPTVSVSNESKTASTTVVSSLTTPTISTTKSQPAIANRETSKLMHSVESILNKTLKKTHHKSNTNTIVLTSVSESKESSPANHCKEKLNKTVSRGTKSCKLEHHSISTAGPSQESDKRNHGSSSQLVAGVKRSQSVIETVDLVVKVDGHVQKPQDIVSTNFTNPGETILNTEVVDDAFSSYIPKFQKHRKLCSVKRSASYEGPTLTPVLGTSNFGDAMEKRNWKKRKLSTLDFDVSKVTTTDCETVKVNNVISISKSDSQDSSGQRETLPPLPADSGSPLYEVVPASATGTGSEGSALNKSATTSQRDHTAPTSVSYLPFMLLQDNSTTNSSETSQIKLLAPETKVESKVTTSRKVNPASTKNNNRISCESRYGDSVHFSKVDKVKNAPCKKQSRVSDSESETTKTYVSKKSTGYIMNKSNNSVNNKCAETPVHGSTNGRPVEEICVEISSSPVDVSNVTSPATYVTSPGTEDRTDGSTLPDIQTSCDNNCVVILSGRGVPLDLSTKQKK